MTESYTDPFTHTPGVCPECGETLSGKITEDEIHDCSDHLSHTELIEHYRFLRDELKRTENHFRELASGTALEKVLVCLKEANQSRVKLGAERYLLEKKVMELESQLLYKTGGFEEIAKIASECLERNR